jgi:hypothetical protein
MMLLPTINKLQMDCKAKFEADVELNPFDDLHNGLSIGFLYLIMK